MARESGVHKIEVHVAGLCFTHKEGDWRCLIARRTETRKLYPGLWEGGGGQMQEGETFEEALLRQMREEFNIGVKLLKPFSTYSIQTKEGCIPGLKFLCLLEGEQTVQLDPQEHVEYAWIKEQDCSAFAFIPGIEEEIAQGFKIIKQL